MKLKKVSKVRKQEKRYRTSIFKILVDACRVLSHKHLKINSFLDLIHRSLRMKVKAVILRASDHQQVALWSRWSAAAARTQRWILIPKCSYLFWNYIDLTTITTNYTGTGLRHWTFAEKHEWFCNQIISNVESHRFNHALGWQFSSFVKYFGGNYYNLEPIK